MTNTFQFKNMFIASLFKAELCETTRNLYYGPLQISEETFLMRSKGLRGGEV